MLHGFAAAAIDLGERDDYPQNSSDGRAVTASILRDAGCSETLPVPTEADLKNSHKRPKWRLLLHAALFLTVAFGIIASAGFAVYKFTPLNSHKSVSSVVDSTAIPSMDARLGFRVFAPAGASNLLIAVTPAQQNDWTSALTDPPNFEVVLRVKPKMSHDLLVSGKNIKQLAFHNVISPSSGEER